MISVVLQFLDLTANRLKQIEERLLVLPRKFLLLLSDTLAGLSGSRTQHYFS